MTNRSHHLKDPDAILDYHINWSEWLNETGDGDYIVTSEWIVPDGITAQDEEFTMNTATVWLAGGTAGKRYPLTNRVTTARGRRDDRTIYVEMRHK